MCSPKSNALGVKFLHKISLKKQVEIRLKEVEVGGKRPGNSLLK